MEKSKLNCQDKIITTTINNNNNDDNCNKNTFTIKIDNPENDKSILMFIDKVNRQYCSILYKCDRTLTYDDVGCLTTKVVGLGDINIPVKFVNSRYIINVFLKFMQCYFAKETKYLACCKRDEMITIPGSEENILNLINNLTQMYNNNNNNNNNNSLETDMEVDDDDDGGGDDENIVDIRDMLMVVMNQFSLLYGNNNNIQKKINTFQKKSNIIGGMPNIDKTNLHSTMKDKFDQTLKHTADRIHELIFKHRTDIYERCQQDIDVIKNVIDKNPHTQLYENVEISNEFMMQTIGKIMHILFLEILPKLSMLDCLYAMLYQATFLNELGILQYYFKIIQLPILYRIIHTFYVDNLGTNDNYNYNNDDDDEKIIKLINRLKNDSNDPLEIFCDLAMKIDLRNENNISDKIYWILNNQRQCTFEYYIIVLISMYILGKCQGMNTKSKKLNGKQFGEPLYALLLHFRKYIVDDINDKTLVFCKDTFDNFNKLYSNEIKKCLKSMTTHATTSSMFSSSNN